MPEWFQYDWEVKGALASFAVDVAFDAPVAEYPVLLYCSTGSLAGNKVFSGMELSRVNKLEKKLLKLLPDALYAGHIHMDALRQYYFYIRSKGDAHDQMEDLLLSEKRLSFHYGFVAEPDWVTYLELLAPDAAKYQTELNAQAIQQQLRAGDSPDKIRRLSLQMGFLTDNDSTLFKEKARQGGFAIGDVYFAPELDKPSVVTLHILSSLDKYEVDSITTRAIRIAETNGGSLLQWTCPKMPKKSPF